MSRGSLIKKTLAIGSSTLVSRFLGFIREMVLIRYLGSGAAADAFIAAFRIPNSLRKIFAEGALSAALIPTLVRVFKEEGQDAASRLMTRVLYAVESFVLAFCVVIAWYAPTIICIIAPGFSAEQVALTVPLLRILIFFIFFISSSAVFAAALQAVHHFFIPSLSQVILNMVAIVGGLICLYYQLPVTALALFFIAGGCLHVALHAMAYYRHKFFLLPADVATKKQAREVGRKFFPALVSAGMIELNLFIDAQFASYLPVGSVALLSYAANFMRIPLGVLVVSFSTILLSHVSRVSTYAPRRLGYYLFESTKLLVWVIIPIALLMGFFAFDIFNTLYVSANFSYADAVRAQWLLIIMLAGLFFFSLNKIMLTIVYALHETFLPTVIILVSVMVNTVLNYLLMGPWGVYGIAAATVIAGGVQTFLLWVLLWKKFALPAYFQDMVRFCIRSTGQLSVIAVIWYGAYAMIHAALAASQSAYAPFFLEKIGLWLWVGPLCGLAALAFWFTRKIWGITLYFLD